VREWGFSLFVYNIVGLILFGQCMVEDGGALIKLLKIELGDGV